MAELRAGVRKALLRWYDAAARDLPWRRTRDAYAIWVSEVMLQQTRVDTVLRYYEPFLSRFPSARALAQASEDEVMAAWSGLGYYRRARLLHAGVREVVERYGGQVPEAPEVRHALPGVGRYTAGAIGSIAFGRPEAVVDGNVTRVFCRLLAIDAPPEQGATQKRLWAEAERLVKGPRPGALNQALMELGATVCVKHNPSCERCPLRGDCQAHARGLAGRLPRAREKRPPRRLELVALIATRDARAGRELWLCRGEGTLFGGLWNLPMIEGRGAGAARALQKASGLEGELGARAQAEIEHVLTHLRLRVRLYGLGSAEARAGSPLRAFGLGELERLGVSRLTKKALAALPLAASTAPHAPRAGCAGPSA